MLLINNKHQKTHHIFKLVKRFKLHSGSLNTARIRERVCNGARDVMLKAATFLFPDFSRPPRLGKLLFRAWWRHLRQKDEAIGRDGDFHRNVPDSEVQIRKCARMSAAVIQDPASQSEMGVVDRILEAKRRAGVQITAAIGEKFFHPAQYRRLLLAIGTVALVIITAVLAWRMAEQYRRLNEANYVESLLLEKKYAHLVGVKPLSTHLWPEWIPLILGDSQQQSRFRTIYLAGIAFRAWGYAGPVSNGTERYLADIKLLARHRPDVFLDHSERTRLFLAHPYRLANGQMIRTVADWEPLMPAEAGIPTEFERKYQGHPDLIRQRARELLVSGVYAALVGDKPQPSQLWQERADIALEMGNEGYFRKWLSDKAWSRANGWEGPIPEPTIQALADLRLLYAFDRELFLDAHERTTTKVDRLWGADPGNSFLFFFRIGKNKGVFIDVASDWEKYVAKIPDGPLLPPQAPEQ